MGYELISQKGPGRKNKRILWDSFVFKNRRRKNPKRASFFVVPPIPFPELEAQEGSVKDSLSVSPPANLSVPVPYAHKDPQEKSSLFIAFNFSV